MVAIEGENCANINKLQAEKNQNVPSENDKQQCEKRINDMDAEYKKLGFFKGKEKKALMEKINAEKSRWNEINSRVQREKQEIIARVDAQITEIQNKTQPIRDEIADLNKQKEQAQAELDKDR